MTGVLQAYCRSTFSLPEKTLFGPGINRLSHLLALVGEILSDSLRQVHIKEDTSLKR